MKKVILTGVLLAMMLTIGGSLGYAGDSQTIAVSCVIPAIPGVNAPLSAGAMPAEITVPVQEAAQEATAEAENLQLVLVESVSGEGELYTYYQK